MFPESALIKQTITLREMSWLGDSALTRRSLSRWIALSLGLMNPRDTRETAARIIDYILEHDVAKNKDITVDDISNVLGIGEKTVYYHLKKLVDMGVLEHKAGKYRWVRGLDGKPTLDKVRSKLDLAISGLERALDEAKRIYI